MQIRLIYITIWVIVLISSSCGVSRQTSKTEIVSNKHNERLNKTVNSIIPSILKIDVLGFYKIWYFEENKAIKKENLDFSKISELSHFSDIVSESVSGTAIVVYADENNYGLLTCAHVVHFPDTIYTYYDLNETKIKSVSIVQEENIYESGNSLKDEYGIVAIDDKRDLAFLKKPVLGDKNLPKLFPLISGDMSKMYWGSQIYVLGFPLGRLMLTDGIVSLNNTKDKRFVSNALFNKGISGGPVFGLQDGSDDFVWLGMAGAAASQSIEYFEPLQNNRITEKKADIYDLAIPRNRQFINYGVTYSISIEEIITFVELNRSKLKAAGIDVDLIFSNKN